MAVGRKAYDYLSGTNIFNFGILFIETYLDYLMIEISYKVYNIDRSSLHAYICMPGYYLG